MQVFLSYDRRDGDAARVLGARLERDGFTVRDGAADRIWELPVAERLGSSDAGCRALLRIWGIGLRPPAGA
jgi:hypothetical protein